eukprot:maker-scaffold2672_size13418-snap-gene-0.0 protein:Tk02002 transcript:maker-scaffold2672_size13418-snap-gene-0.0-mRNA-1 annotation:"lysyl-trna synthetase"
MTDNNNSIDENEVEAVDENKLIAQRREKLNEWRETNNAYPNDFKRSHLSNALVKSYDGHEKEWFDDNVIEVKLAGRLMSKRIMGKASFAHIQDQSGRIQMYVQKAAMGEEAYEYFKHMDIGDIVGITEKFHGMTDQEMRYRMRYVDLIVNEKSKNTFVTRSKLINYLRNYLNNEDYLEIESPMMQSIPGGASAKPFVTHHKSLDLKMYLRVAQELYIKRCLVGGFDKLNDPEDQTARLLDQAAAKDAGDEEAMYFDADYIRAMEYGMPPNAGSGIGIDRLVMLFTDSHTIRDVILFPHMRPENNDSH